MVAEIKFEEPSCRYAPCQLLHCNFALVDLLPLEHSEPTSRLQFDLRVLPSWSSCIQCSERASSLELCLAIMYSTIFQSLPRLRLLEVATREALFGVFLNFALAAHQPRSPPELSPMLFLKVCYSLDWSLHPFSRRTWQADK